MEENGQVYMELIDKIPQKDRERYRIAEEYANQVLEEMKREQEIKREHKGAVPVRGAEEEIAPEATGDGEWPYGQD